MNAIATIEQPAQRQHAGAFIVPQSFGELLKYAEVVSKSTLVPKDYQGRPENVAIAMQWAIELGVSPLQGLTGIAVINGRPSVWGDLAAAVVRARPDLELLDETFETDAAGQVVGAVCRIKRRGQPEQVRRFTRHDAQAAGLLGKSGPWQQYPARMMQMRARSFAMRDVFPDALRGLSLAEEMQDVEVVSLPTASAQPAAIAGPKRRSEAQAAPAQPVQAATAPEAPAAISGELLPPEPEQDAAEHAGPEDQDTGQAVVDLPPAKLRILQATLDRAGKTEADVLAGFGGVSEANLNDALKWVRS